MTVWSDEPTRDDATTETRYTIFGVPLLMASLTLALPVMPIVAYLLGSGTIDGVGMWLNGVGGWIWSIGLVLLIVLEVVRHTREVVKYMDELTLNGRAD